ncbi:unnamed protein product [Trichogramma brassicae]|uniref:Uncharacterized protein n=1 Tax=Trichogramma brassicae TaxID=86971 RepID=A0A6H5IGR2_9HYME|nr:unnamed protein product [Trichogramma brassicae]
MTMGMSIPAQAVTLRERILFGCILVVGLFYSSTILAHLTSLNLDLKAHKKFKTYRDLEESGLIPFVHPYAFNMTFRLSNDPTLHRLGKKAYRNIDMDKCLEWLLNRANVSCIMARNRILNLLPLHSGRMKQAEPCFWSSYRTFIMRQGSPYTLSFNRMIRIAQESGIVSKWWRRFHEDGVSSSYKKNSVNESLQLIETNKRRYRPKNDSYWRVFFLLLVDAAPQTAAAASATENLPAFHLLGLNTIEEWVRINNNSNNYFFDNDLWCSATAELARKAVGPINIDRVIDNNIDRIRRGLSLFDPAKLIDQAHYWNRWIYAKLFDGQLKRVSTMYRAGTCTLTYSGKITTANLNVGWDVMSFLYGYYYDVFFWSGRGKIYGDLSNLRVNLEVDIDFSNYQIVFKSLKFHDNGKLVASSDGFWSNIVVKVAIWLAHDAILRQVEVMANDIMAAEIALLNQQIGSGHRPFTFLNLVKSNRRSLASLSLRSLEQEFAADEYHPNEAVVDVPSPVKVEQLEKVLQRVEENKMKNRIDL